MPDYDTTHNLTLQFVTHFAGFGENSDREGNEVILGS
jgi:hypothetical protein